RETDRDVQPEDPLPGDALDDRAADEWPERDREAADAAPGAECEPALLGRDGGAEDRQRQGRHDRAADALKGSRRIHPLARRSECRECGRSGEDAEPEYEQPAPP